MRNKASRSPVIQPEDTSTKLIVLTLGQVALVDAEDYERLNTFSWRAVWSPLTTSYYAARTSQCDGKRTTVLMHRVVLQYDGPLHVDHILGNTLDNRKSHIRLATNGQNQANKGLQKNSSTGFKGVTCRYGRYISRLTVNKKTIWLGVFCTAEEAHDVYVRKAVEVYGDFARAA